MINITLSHEEGTFYYFICSITGILVGIILAGVEARKNNMSLRAFGAMVSTGIISMIVGSKLILFDHLQWSALFDQGQLAAQNAKSIVGAMIGGMIGVWLAGKWYGYKKSVLELFAVAGFVALAIQRIGCLFSGCCHGVITSAPWGITYGPETQPYLEQIQLGLISADAPTSLPVLPDPIFNIIACAGFALLVKWSGSKWKANGSKFLFAVLLYLGFRFMEDFSRFYLHPDNWYGLSSMQWKILFSFTPLFCLLFFREKRALKNTLPISEKLNVPGKANHTALMHSVFNLIVFLLLIPWLTPDEQLIIFLVMLPLDSFWLIVDVLRLVTSPKYVTRFAIVGLSIVLMSQKADVQQEKQTSFTAFDFKSISGRFDRSHNLDFAWRDFQDCDGNPSHEYVGVPYAYRHIYQVYGAGVKRKSFYNGNQSLTYGLHVYLGHETENPFYVPNDTFTPPGFKNKIFSFNPSIEYDTKGIGLGLGGSFGTLGFDEQLDQNIKDDYIPSMNKRSSSIQARIRLFNEKKFFVEANTGYGFGDVGIHTWDFSMGSRFNTPDFLLKAGLGNTGGDPFYIFQTEVPLSHRFILSSTWMHAKPKELNVLPSPDYTSKGASRFTLGLEYRIFDKKHKPALKKK